jgi:hypothetical protein
MLIFDGTAVDLGLWIEFTVNIEVVVVVCFPRCVAKLVTYPRLGTGTDVHRGTAHLGTGFVPDSSCLGSGAAISGEKGKRGGVILSLRGIKNIYGRLGLL